ncbi:hypothetical protein A7982_13723 [Minicystis rosea]|nr:hypothetical protein A7982_13723 [Minicystis rosea]
MGRSLHVPSVATSIDASKATLPSWATVLRHRIFWSLRIICAPRRKEVWGRPLPRRGRCFDGFVVRDRAA